jgi:hypothetical protein
MITRWDKLLIICLIAIALICICISARLDKDADTLIIKIGGKEAIRMPLSNDREFDVQGPLGITRIKIKNRYVRVMDSPCKRKICVETGWIRKSHQHIICVPNQVFIYLEGGRDEKIDGITE